MNAGTNISKALSLVTPRPVGQRGASEPAAVNAAERRVLARVPDMRRAITEPAPVESKPAYGYPGFKLPRIPWEKMPDRRALARGLAACWLWIAGVPPIVKVGALTVSLVAAIWMFNKDPKEVAKEDDANQASQRYRAGPILPPDANSPAARTAARDDAAWRWDGATARDQATARDNADAAFPNSAASAPAGPGSAGHEETHHKATPRGSEENRQPEPWEQYANEAPHDRRAPPTEVAAEVQPIAPYRQPLTERDGYSRHAHDAHPAAMPVDGRVRSVEEHYPDVPHMDERFTRRPADTHRGAVGGVQYNHHVSDPIHNPAPPRSVGYDRAIEDRARPVERAAGDDAVSIASRRPEWDASRQRSMQDREPPPQRR